MRFSKFFFISISFFLCALACQAKSKPHENKSIAEIGMIRSGLSDADPEIRCLSASVIGILADTDSIDAVKNLLYDTNDSVKIKAAVALLKLGDRSGISILRKVLGSAPKISENPTPLERARSLAKGATRAEAARALGDIKDFDSSPLLQRMSEDTDGRVADASLIALAKLGDGYAKERFVSALKSTKQGVRAKACEALGEIGDINTAAMLRERLTDWDRDVKACAIMALAKMNDRESISQIKVLLSDKEDIIREKAALALGVLGAQDASGDLKKALSDSNGFVRIQVAGALYSLGDDSGKDFLIKALKANEKEVKLKALGVLEKIAGTGERQVLEPLLADPDKTIAITSAKIIYKINKLGELK